MQILYATKNSNFERSCDELGHFYASSKAPISLSCDHYSPESTPSPFSSLILPNSENNFSNFLFQVNEYGWAWIFVLTFGEEAATERWATWTH